MPPHVASLLQNNYPAAANYLARLPEGLDAFPQCQMLAEGPLSFRAVYPQVFQRPDLPGAVKRLVQAPWKPNDWVPMVLAVTMNEMVRDHLRMGEAEYLAVAVKLALSFLDRPAYRGMCRVLSPHLLLMGFHWRWSHFHRGIPMYDGGGSKQRHTLRMEYPVGLLPSISIKYYGLLFKRLLMATGVAGAQVNTQQVGAGETTYEMVWEG